MLSDKLAQIMSSLAPPFKGKPAAPTTAPRAKAPTTPGIGAKMREETSHSLEKMLKEGSFTTGLENLVKMARAMGKPPPIPAAALRGTTPPPAAPKASWGDMHAGIAKQQAQSTRATPAQLPAPPSLHEGMGVAPGGGGGMFANSGGAAPPPTTLSGAPRAAPAAAAKPGMGQRLMRGGGKTLGLMGLGAGAAAMYGMHRQSEDDRQRQSLVYAPLPGSMMQ